MQAKGGSIMDQIAGEPVLSGRFWLNNSLLDRTRLDRFIFYSIIVHLIVFILQALIPVRSSLPPPPPPIKVNYMDAEKPRAQLEPGTIVDAPKPEKAEKPRSSQLLASNDSRAHSNLQPTREKEYRRHKTVVPKSTGVPQESKKVLTPPQKNNSASTARQKSEDSQNVFPLSDKGAFLPQTREEQQTEVKSSLSSGAKGSLSLLDGFDPNKYASLDTETAEEADDDEAVSLDTTETEYASYFARIKHQIERVWTYPAEAAERGVSGQLTLRFRISKDGNLLGVRLVEKSGHEILDFAALKAVKEAAPFYPFPIDIKKDKLSILATFIYSPTYGLLKK